MLQITRHWTSNKLGHYQLETCHGSVGDLPHLLITCHAQHHTQSWLGGFHSNDLSCTYHSQEKNVGNDFDKDCKMVPLNIFVQQIFYSPPWHQISILHWISFLYWYQRHVLHLWTDIISIGLFLCKNICLLHSQRKANWYERSACTSDQHLGGHYFRYLSFSCCWWHCSKPQKGLS